MLTLLALFFLSSFVQQSVQQNRSFVIDYNRDIFLKDGQPYRYISGSMHYFRIPKHYWSDRLLKIRACGLNAVQFYIPWNIHEPRPDEFNFQDENDVVYFLTLCRKYGLDAIVRIGPYTCGEFENGGLPWWLLKFRQPDVRMRRADPRFLYRMSKWYARLMPLLLPLLYKNGGPVISIQIENEYGSRVYCDREYTLYLRDLIRSYVGRDFLLFTVDGAGVDYLKCGVIPDVYPTVDFGCGSRSDVERAFAAQRAYAAKGPLVNSEFYPGWLDLWGRNHSTGDTGSILDSMEYMYKMGASFNFYMFEENSNVFVENQFLIGSAFDQNSNLYIKN
uniref:Glycoside hydrolase 35 catalytic domain-containing protein n=1 Tax=Romanomermis culicivorax TaxID=13658 RepID=A0A915HFL7_ROMCU